MFFIINKKNVTMKAIVLEQENSN